MRVAVRVRPAPPGSSSAECINCLPDGRTLEIDGGTGSTVRARSFAFDAVHQGDTTQEGFFHGCGVTQLLDAVLDGYTATVFAYGQTGSGKTFTTAGAAAPHVGVNGALHADAGMMQRTVQYLYAGMAARPGEKYTVCGAPPATAPPPPCSTSRAPGARDVSGDLQRAGHRPDQPRGGALRARLAQRLRRLLRRGPLRRAGATHRQGWLRHTRQGVSDAPPLPLRPAAPRTPRTPRTPPPERERGS